MRDFLLGRGIARPFIYRGLRPMMLAMALVLSGVGPRAEPILALSAPSQPVPIRKAPVMPVPGWIRFCKQRPKECAVNRSEPATITLTHRVWETLTGINRQVNTTIRSVTDREHWGIEDRWDLAEDGYGDCEDYQLVKRKLLVAAGFPRRALRITAVLDEGGEPHAVLMVRTDRGDFILDNKRDAVLSWRQTGYIYLQREVETGLTWVSLGGAFALPVTTGGRRLPRH